VLGPSQRMPIGEGYNSHCPNETSLASLSYLSMEGKVPLLAGFGRYGLAPTGSGETGASMTPLFEPSRNPCCSWSEPPNHWP
jgi:hypothetical protein